MASATYDQTYDSLTKLSEIINGGLYDLGRARGRNDLPSDEDLRKLVLGTSKRLLLSLPCLQSEDDNIEEMDSKYSCLMTRM